MNVSSDGGAVEVEQSAPSSYPFIFDLDNGVAVTIEAVPSFGHVFDGWSGDLSGTPNPAILIMDCDKNITANFSIDWTLVIAATVGLVIVGLLVTAIIIRRRAG